MVRSGRWGLEANFIRRYPYNDGMSFGPVDVDVVGAAAQDVAFHALLLKLQAIHASALEIVKALGARIRGEGALQNALNRRCRCVLQRSTPRRNS